MGYRVDDDGNIYGPKGRILKNSKNNTTGYCHVVTFTKLIDGTRRSLCFYTHRLAAYQWFGDATLADNVEVRHLDGNKLNNKRSNLALGTHSQNMRDVAPELRQKKAQKAADQLKALTPEQVLELRAMRAAGARYIDLMEIFGIAKSTVAYIVQRKTYRDVW